MSFADCFVQAMFLIGASLLASLEPVSAQVFKNLHNFDNASDGRQPDYRLVLSSNTLYGVASPGGQFDRGTVFSVQTDGTAFTVVHQFGDADFSTTNQVGDDPSGELVLSGSILYGTTVAGGISGVGTVFRINTDGSGFALLHSFTPLSTEWPRYTNTDGAYPVGNLVLSGGTLYGVAPRGGGLGNGMVFAVSTNGTGFTNLHSFADNEGGYSQAGLVLFGDTLYGTTYQGGASNNGTIFKLLTNGSGFAVLHTFGATPGSYPYTNLDGAHSEGALVVLNNMLYGTTVDGGTNGYGTVFAVGMDGNGFTNLHAFTAVSSTDTSATNIDGASPQAGLTLAGDLLTGTATAGGSFGAGTIFAIDTKKQAFTTLHSFPRGDLVPINLYTNGEGSFPRGELVYSDHCLYGTAGEGGSMGWGAVFGLSLRPELKWMPSGSDLVLMWPMNVVGFTNSFVLESTTNLVGPTFWIPADPNPPGVNGIYTVTNSTSGPQMFYRLRESF